MLTLAASALTTLLTLQTAGGIYLPETGKKLNEGEVIAVGPGALTREGKTLPMNVRALSAGLHASPVPSCRSLPAAASLRGRDVNGAGIHV